MANPTKEILTTNKGRWNIKELSDFCIKWQWSKCNTIDSNASITKLLKNWILELNLMWSFIYQDIQLIVTENIFSDIFRQLHIHMEIETSVYLHTLLTKLTRSKYA